MVQTSDTTMKEYNNIYLVNLRCIREIGFVALLHDDPQVDESRLVKK